MNLHKLLFFALSFIVPLGAWSQGSQTFNGGAGPIPDNQTFTLFPLNVANLNASPITTNWGFEKITLNITHTWDADLEVWLKSPDGTEVLLFNGVGGDGDNFTNTAFKNNYTTSIIAGTAPFTGNFLPMGDLGSFNNGQTGTGTWYLKIRDNYGQDAGDLVSWNIRFGNAPAIPRPPLSSNLPIIKINTGGQAIPDDPKIPVDFAIIDNGNGQLNHANDTNYAYHNLVGIEQRGSSSGSAPKKSYGFELWDSAFNSINASLLGMPAESDWILSASYYDKTLMRNVLSYHLANQTGHYAPRTRYCEVIMDGQYVGVYVLMEKIKRDNNRVDIAKLTTSDTAGEELTGGYILKIDKFTGSGGDGFYSRYSPSNPSGDTIFIQYEYPSQQTIQPQQKAYIQSFVDSFETALFGPAFQDPANGFRRYASEKSLMDYLFINEMSKNVDGYRLSTFLYKDKQDDDGRLRLGPVWDYDIAWANADYCNASAPTGWAYDVSYTCPGAALPAWWERLRQDSLFNQHLYCRWNYLRSNVLSFDSILEYIDATAAYIDTAQQRNFTTWPIIGVATWPEPQPLPQTYGEEIQRLKTWVTDRLTWMDQQFNALPHNPVYVTLGADTSFCSGDTIQLYAGDFDTYQWNTNNPSATQQVLIGGTYTVTVADKFQCSGNASVTINELPAPQINLGNDTAICEGSGLLLTATNGAAYLWNTGENTAAITALQAGSYIVTVTGANNCSASSRINVYTRGLPNAAIITSLFIDAAVQFEAADTNGITHVWYFGNGDSSTLANPFYNYAPAYGNFLVTHIATDAFGCSATDTLTVRIYNTGIQQADINTIQVYPNPATHILNITSSNAEIHHLTIKDVVGKTCQKYTVGQQNAAVSIEELAAGLYFIDVTLLNGKALTFRFIKQ
jgi:subtilisin-like proprotein convertase family protein